MEKLLIKVYKNRKLSLFLKISCHVMSLIFVLALCGEAGALIYRKEYMDCALVLLSAFVGFVLVSLMRRLINAPRPYELYTFYEEKPKEREGRSFPSRHVYSAFAIATLTFFVSNIIAVILIVLALAMCVCRVLLGIHFIRDVVCGALIGVIAGLVGLLIL